MGNKKLFAPSADRNKDPILEILQKYYPYEKNKDNRLVCLEISSGTGQHVVHFAKSLPFMTFQPSEFTISNLPSIREYVVQSGLTNVLSPLAIDVTDPIDRWNLARENFDLILNINMMHISPWECTLSLFEKAGKLLSSNGLLITYGPYAHHGLISPESNIIFDQSLKARDVQWGLRDIDELQSVANRNGLELMGIENMPSNNKTLVWKNILNQSERDVM
ncbi:methyltransferase-like 26 [Daphnia carinata]|uniref:methyltransferase-like 26 n=1 Tax=Daphnia carinata TaxID=120202 RepID=UPI002580FCF0|nr:methyltransferase-like 26 [Daphnia carinata]